MQIGGIEVPICIPEVFVFVLAPLAPQATFITQHFVWWTSPINWLRPEKQWNSCVLSKSSLVLTKPSTSVVQISESPAHQEWFIVLRLVWYDRRLITVIMMMKLFGTSWNKKNPSKFCDAAIKNSTQYWIKTRWFATYNVFGLILRQRKPKLLCFLWVL